MRHKISTGFRLTPEAKAIIVKLADELGVSQADIVEMAVRQLEMTFGKFEKAQKE